MSVLSGADVKMREFVIGLILGWFPSFFWRFAMLFIIPYCVNCFRTFDKLIDMLIGIPFCAFFRRGFDELGIPVNRRKTLRLRRLGDRTGKWVDLCHPAFFIDQNT